MLNVRVILQTVLNQHRDEIESQLMLKSLGQLSKLSKDAAVNAKDILNKNLD